MQDTSRENLSHVLFVNGIMLNRPKGVFADQEVINNEWHLTEIDNISVREIAGKGVVKQACGKDVNVVLDPVLLVGREFWDKTLKEATISYYSFKISILCNMIHCVRSVLIYPFDNRMCSPSHIEIINSKKILGISGALIIEA